MLILQTKTTQKNVSSILHFNWEFELIILLKNPFLYAKLLLNFMV